MLCRYPFRSYFTLVTLHFFIALVINCPTRVTDNTATLMDNIYTNFNSNIVNPAIIINDLSDHFPIMTWFGHDTIKSMKIGYKISRQVNDKLLSKLAEQLRNTDWNYMYVGLRTAINKSDPNLAYENFARIYKEIYNKIFTKVEICASRRSPKKPWMTTGY